MSLSPTTDSWLSINFPSSHDFLSHKQPADQAVMDSGSDPELVMGYASGTAALMSNASSLSPDEKLIIEDFFNGSIFGSVTETILILVFSILILSGFIFNSLMIVVILLSEKLRRMPFNILLLNLCVSNVLLSLFCMPFTLLGLIRRGWFFGPALCKVIPSLQGIGVCVSATTVTVIAFDRYFTIVYRERHQSGRPQRRPTGGGAGSSALNRQNYCQVGIETGIIWIVGIMCGLPVSLFQVVVTFPQYSDEYIQCIEDWPRTLKSAYSLTILLVQCVLPSVALTVTGSAITSHLKRVAGLLSAPRPSAQTSASRSTNLNNVSRPVTPAVAAAATEIVVTPPTAPPASDATNEANGGKNVTVAASPSVASNLQSVSGTNNNNNNSSSAGRSSVLGPVAADCHQRNVERNQSVTRTLLAVSISFTVCWMPLHILNALIDVGLVTHETLGEHAIYLMIAVCSCVAMTSVPLNALLYGWYNPSINREVITWRLIPCADREEEEEDESGNNNNTSAAASRRPTTSGDIESQVTTTHASCQANAVRDSRISTAPRVLANDQTVTSI